MRAYSVDDKVVIEVDKLEDEIRIELVIKEEDPTTLEPMEMEPEVIRRSRRRYVFDNRYRPKMPRDGTLPWGKIHRIKVRPKSGYYRRA